MAGPLLLEKELIDQERLALAEPYLAREALLESLVAEGLDRPAAYRVVQTLATRQELLLRTVQEKVLGLGSADLSQPFRAGAVMFLSYAIGALIRSCRSSCRSARWRSRSPGRSP